MADVHGTSALKRGEKFTLAQRNAWPDNERWELIAGEAFAMSPAPRKQHQRLTLKLAKDIDSFLEGKPCEAYIAPFDVFLTDESDEADTVVQPDVLVVCDPDKVQDDGVHGAPDLVAEVLSDSTAFKDLTQKKAAYERAGVKEYWVLNPESCSILLFVLENGRYKPAREILKGSPAESSVLSGFVFQL